MRHITKCSAGGSTADAEEPVSSTKRKRQSPEPAASQPRTTRRSSAGGTASTVTPSPEVVVSHRSSIASLSGKNTKPRKLLNVQDKVRKLLEKKGDGPDEEEDERKPPAKKKKRNPTNDKKKKGRDSSRNSTESPTVGESHRTTAILQKKEPPKSRSASAKGRVNYFTPSATLSSCSNGSSSSSIMHSCPVCSKSFPRMVSKFYS